MTEEVRLEGSSPLRLAHEETDSLSRVLADFSPVGIFRTDENGVCVYVNSRWCEITGLAEEAAVGEGWRRALHPDDRERVVRAWTATSEGGRPFRLEHRFLRPNGEICWVIAEAYRAENEAGETTGHIGTVTDISALKAAEEALRSEKELTENIIGSSIDGILAFDRECRYTVWNPAMEHISGISASETLGNCAFEVFPFLKEIGEDWYFFEALAGRCAVARDRRFTIPSTGRSGFFEGHYVPLRNAQNEVIGGIGIIRDITELKEVHAQILQAGKLAAMGQLGAGIAHELNQPLTGIQLLLNMILDSPNRRIEEFGEDLEMIAEQVTRMARIVDNVRGFARKSSLELQPTTPTEPLDRALMLMVEQLRLAGIEVVKTIEQELPPIHADSVQLQQVFLNLLSNAQHAVENGSEKKRIEIGARLRDGRVEYWVQDSGQGLSPEAREKAFDPFFTTKEPGRGTGLGLSLCYGILQNHGGEISIEEAHGGGTRVVFQVGTAGDDQVVGEVEGTAPPEATPRVLIVDDEAVLRRVVGRCLTLLGFSFEAVKDASGALSLAERTPIDIAIVDLKMPVVDGRELCAQLRSRHPDMKLIVMSGFVTDDERAELAELGVQAVLSKPFSYNELGQTLERVLQS